ncbi:hypothetical protein ACWGTI_23045 [Mesorhizobium sp. ArgA1]
MLDARKAIESDIKSVMTSLSATSAGELITAGRTIEEATEQMVEWSGEGEAIAIDSDNSPIAILIFRDEDANVLGTSFMATEQFFTGWLPTRFLKRYVDAKMKKLPGVAVVSTTYSQHPSLHRWYRLMGYRDPATDGVSFTFVREPR